MSISLSLCLLSYFNYSKITLESSTPSNQAVRLYDTVWESYQRQNLKRCINTLRRACHAVWAQIENNGRSCCESGHTLPVCVKSFSPTHSDAKIPAVWTHH